MELRHLRNFLVVAETLNISEAARRIRITQPALSKQIKELERAVGHDLFVRCPGKLLLTPAGLALNESGQQVIAGAEIALVNARAAADSETANLRVGYYGTVSIWSLILAPALEKLHRKVKRTETSIVEMMPAQLLAELRLGKLDLAILGPGIYPEVPNIAIEIACTMPGMAMMAADHRLAKKRMISIEDLRGETIIGTDPRVSPGRDQSLIDACGAAGFSPKISIAATNYLEGITAVKQRSCIGIIGTLALAAPHPGVVFVKIKPPGVPMNVFVGYPKNGSRPIRLLAELIVEAGRRAVAKP